MGISLVADQRALAIAALFRPIRARILIALAFLAIGCALGYLVGTATAPHSPPPSPAVARYMAGVQQSEGTEVWASMSPDFQAQIIREGDTPASFAAFYRQLRQRGNRIDQVQYVGGYQTREKGIFIYVTRRFDPGKEPLEIIWILVTGPEGLVDDVL